MKQNNSRPMRLIGLICVIALAFPASIQAEAMLDAMKQELDRSVENFSRSGKAPLYFMQFTVTEQRRLLLQAREGGLDADDTGFNRFIDVNLRVGSPQLDNTHEIRGGSWRDNFTPRRVIKAPLKDDLMALRAALWAEAEFQYNQAQERLTKVLTNRQVKVEEQDLSADFSSAEPQEFLSEPTPLELDTVYWRGLVKEAGVYFRQFPFVNQSSARFSVNEETTYMVNSEGSRLKHGYAYIRMRLEVSGMADDGMQLERTESYDASSVGRLPSREQVFADAERLVKELRELLSAPVVEPYMGPAILRNRASGVFFHEIFGHRIEGHRQKSEREGQTFTKQVGKPILAPFITVMDDPTLKDFNGTDLRGYYRFDDEGVAARRVTLVERGILKGFLTSRSPIENFPASNGHGRREYGNQPVSRQGNLIVLSDTTVPADRLRDLLVAECKRQGKPYGLVFEDISGGFTMTGRGGPQAFKVRPLMVYRVYTDGRPDEMVRGVDIVGTPLTSFSKIVIAGDDPQVFNGSCGAESGWVPVSAVSPSILISEIEVEKSRKGQEKPPILPAPGGER